MDEAAAADEDLDGAGAAAAWWALPEGAEVVGFDVAEWPVSGDEWRPLGPVVRLGCPCCDLVVDEPPAETSAELGGDALTYRIRHRSAVPSLAAHVLADHPESAAAEHVRAAIAEHGSVEQAVRAELELLVRAALPGPLPGPLVGQVHPGHAS